VDGLFQTEGFEDKGALTVLSFGGGQDSTWILYKLALDPEFRALHAPGRLLVVGSDTGDEHPETIEHIEFVRDFCKVHDIEFYWLTSDMGFHSDSWATLMTQYYKNSTVGSVMFSRTCTDNLKIQPMYRFLGHWLREQGYAPGSKNAAEPFRAFAMKHGRVRMTLGFTFDEGKRVDKTLKRAASAENPAYRRDCIEFSFPLVGAGMDRAAVQVDIKAMNLPLPPPSNCLRCHFRSDLDLIWLHRRHPEKFIEWEEREDAKLTRFAYKGEKNLGVYGKIRLRAKLEAAIAANPNITMEQLEENRMTHGHCISNSF
jgi:hypothetical protein